MVQLVRGSLVESLVRGSTHMSSHSPLGPRIQGPGYSWFEDFQLEGRNLWSGIQTPKGLGSHMSSHNPIRPRVPGKSHPKNHLARKETEYPGIG